MNKQQMIQALENAYQIASVREKDYKLYESERKQLQDFEKLANNFPLERIPQILRPIVILLALPTLCITFAKDKGFFANEDTALLICLGMVAIAFVIAVRKLINAKKAYFNSTEYKEKLLEIQDRKEELAALEARIKESYQKSISAFGLLSKQYHNCFTLERLIHYFENGRADTLKEALAIYEEDCHRMRMEESQNQLLEEMQNLQNKLTQLEQTTRQVVNEIHYHD